MDFLSRLRTDWVDILMLHFIDLESDYESAFNGGLLQLAQKYQIEAKAPFIGMNSHSKSSSTLTFLQTVAPGVCIISSRGSSRSGLPHFDTLMRLQQIGCRILRVDQVGAVQITVASEGLRVKSFLE